MTPALDFLASTLVSEGVRTCAWTLLRTRSPRTYHNCDSAKCPIYIVGMNASVYHHQLKGERLTSCLEGQKLSYNIAADAKTALNVLTLQ